MFIFLDIDGVMVPARMWKTPKLLEDGFPPFSSEAIAALKLLLEENTTVILTTSHRDRFSVGDWHKIFRKRGLDIPNLSSLPPAKTPSHRKEEIESWISTHPMSQDFLIIDDDTRLLSLPTHIRSRLLLTKPLIGLTLSSTKQFSI